MNTPQFWTVPAFLARRSILLLLIVVLGWIVSINSAAAQNSQPKDPAAVVTAFNDALSRQDLATALTLLDDNFLYVSGPGSAFPNDRKKGEFPGQPPFQQIAQSNINPIDANTVEMDITFTGGPIPPLPHPFMLHATFRVENGLITRLQDRLSDQTAQDLAALGTSAPAALPRTGANESSIIVWLFVFGIVCVLAGAVTIRSASRR